MLPGIALYFLPSILAHNKNNFGGVFAVNLLLGWTFVGWIVALIWALAGEHQPVVVVHQAAGYGATNFCTRCGRPQVAGARFCANCGSVI